MPRGRQPKCVDPTGGHEVVWVMQGKTEHMAYLIEEHKNGWKQIRWASTDAVAWIEPDVEVRKDFGGRSSRRRGPPPVPFVPPEVPRTNQRRDRERQQRRNYKDSDEDEELELSIATLTSKERNTTSTSTTTAAAPSPSSSSSKKDREKKSSKKDKKEKKEKASRKPDEEEEEWGSALQERVGSGKAKLEKKASKSQKSRREKEKTNTKKTTKESDSGGSKRKSAVMEDSDYVISEADSYEEPVKPSRKSKRARIERLESLDEQAIDEMVQAAERDLAAEGEQRKPVALKKKTGASSARKDGTSRLGGSSKDDKPTKSKALDAKPPPALMLSDYGKGTRVAKKVPDLGWISGKVKSATENYCTIIWKQTGVQDFLPKAAMAQLVYDADTTRYPIKTRVRKRMENDKPKKGRVHSLDNSLYHITYNDGSTEVVGTSEMDELVAPKRRKSPQPEEESERGGEVAAAAAAAAEVDTAAISRKESSQSAGQSTEPEATKTRGSDPPPQGEEGEAVEVETEIEPPPPSPRNNRNNENNEEEEEGSSLKLRAKAKAVEVEPQGKKKVEGEMSSRKPKPKPKPKPKRPAEQVESQSNNDAGSALKSRAKAKEVELPSKKNLEGEEMSSRKPKPKQPVEEVGPQSNNSLLDKEASNKHQPTSPGKNKGRHHVKATKKNKPDPSPKASSRKLKHIAIGDDDTEARSPKNSKEQEVELASKVNEKPSSNKQTVVSSIYTPSRKPRDPPADPPAPAVSVEKPTLQSTSVKAAPSSSSKAVSNDPMEVDPVDETEAVGKSADKEPRNTETDSAIAIRVEEVSGMSSPPVADMEVAEDKVEPPAEKTAAVKPTDVDGSKSSKSSEKNSGDKRCPQIESKQSAKDKKFNDARKEVSGKLSPPVREMEIAKDKAEPPGDKAHSANLDGKEQSEKSEAAVAIGSDETTASVDKQSAPPLANEANSSDAPSAQAEASDTSPPSKAATESSSSSTDSKTPSLENEKPEDAQDKGNNVLTSEHKVARDTMEATADKNAFSEDHAQTSTSNATRNTTKAANQERKATQKDSKSHEPASSSACERKMDTSTATQDKEELGANSKNEAAPREQVSPSLISTGTNKKLDSSTATVIESPTITRRKFKGKDSPRSSTFSALGRLLGLDRSSLSPSVARKSKVKALGSKQTGKETSSKSKTTDAVSSATTSTPIEIPKLPDFSSDSKGKDGSGAGKTSSSSTVANDEEKPQKSMQFAREATAGTDASGAKKESASTDSDTAAGDARSAEMPVAESKKDESTMTVSLGEENKGKTAANGKEVGKPMDVDSKPSHPATIEEKIASEEKNQVKEAKVPKDASWKDEAKGHTAKDKQTSDESMPSNDSDEAKLRDLNENDLESAVKDTTKEFQKLSVGNSDGEAPPCSQASATQEEKSTVQDADTSSSEVRKQAEPSSSAPEPVVKPPSTEVPKPDGDTARKQAETTSSAPEPAVKSPSTEVPKPAALPPSSQSTAPVVQDLAEPTSKMLEPTKATTSSLPTDTLAKAQAFTTTASHTPIVAAVEHGIGPSILKGQGTEQPTSSSPPSLAPALSADEKAKKGGERALTSPTKAGDAPFKSAKPATSVSSAEKERSTTSEQVSVLGATSARPADVVQPGRSKAVQVASERIKQIVLGKRVASSSAPGREGKKQKTSSTSSADESKRQYAEEDTKQKKSCTSSAAQSKKQKPNSDAPVGESTTQKKSGPSPAEKLEKQQLNSDAPVQEDKKLKKSGTSPEESKKQKSNSDASVEEDKKLKKSDTSPAEESKNLKANSDAHGEDGTRSDTSPVAEVEKQKLNSDGPVEEVKKLTSPAEELKKHKPNSSSPVAEGEKQKRSGASPAKRSKMQMPNADAPIEEGKNHKKSSSSPAEEGKKQKKSGVPAEESKKKQKKSGEPAEESKKQKKSGTGGKVKRKLPAGEKQSKTKRPRTDGTDSSVSTTASVKSNKPKSPASTASQKKLSAVSADCDTTTTRRSADPPGFSKTTAKKGNAAAPELSNKQKGARGEKYALQYPIPTSLSALDKPTNNTTNPAGSIQSALDKARSATAAAPKPRPTTAQRGKSRGKGPAPASNNSQRKSQSAGGKHAQDGPGNMPTMGSPQVAPMQGTPTAPGPAKRPGATEDVSRVPVPGVPDNMRRAPMPGVFNPMASTPGGPGMRGPMPGAPANPQAMFPPRPPPFGMQAPNAMQWGQMHNPPARAPNAANRNTNERRHGRFDDSTNERGNTGAPAAGAPAGAPAGLTVEQQALAHLQNIASGGNPALYFALGRPGASVGGGFPNQGLMNPAAQFLGGGGANGGLSTAQLVAAAHLGLLPPQRPPQAQPAAPPPANMPAPGANLATYFAQNQPRRTRGGCDPPGVSPPNKRR